MFINNKQLKQDAIFYGFTMILWTITFGFIFYFFADAENRADIIEKQNKDNKLINEQILEEFDKIRLSCERDFKTKELMCKSELKKLNGNREK